MKSARLLPVLIATLFAFPFRSPAEDGKNNGKDTAAMNVIQLAALFAQNKPMADAQYRGKQITVTGTVNQLDQGNAAEGVLAYIYLQTAPGLPRIKVELTNLDNFMLGHENKTAVNIVGSNTQTIKRNLNIRINNNTLEAQVSLRGSWRGSHSLNYHQSGAWQYIVKCGDSLTVTGLCKGQIVYIVIGNVAL